MENIDPNFPIKANFPVPRLLLSPRGLPTPRRHSPPQPGPQNQELKETPDEISNDEWSDNELEELEVLNRDGASLENIIELVGVLAQNVPTKFASEVLMLENQINMVIDKAYRDQDMLRYKSHVAGRRGEFLSHIARTLRLRDILQCWSLVSRRRGKKRDRVKLEYLRHNAKIVGARSFYFAYSWNNQWILLRTFRAWEDMTNAPTGGGGTIVGHLPAIPSTPEAKPRLIAEACIKDLPPLPSSARSPTRRREVPRKPCARPVPTPATAPTPAFRMAPETRLRQSLSSSNLQVIRQPLYLPQSFSTHNLQAESTPMSHRVQINSIGHRSPPAPLDQAGPRQQMLLQGQGVRAPRLSFNLSQPRLGLPIFKPA